MKFEVFAHIATHFLQLVLLKTPISLVEACQNQMVGKESKQKTFRSATKSVETEELVFTGPL